MTTKKRLFLTLAAGLAALLLPLPETAALAGLAAGVWSGLEELTTLRRSQHVFLPQREEQACAADYRQWHRAVERSRDWIENDV